MGSGRPETERASPIRSRLAGIVTGTLIALCSAPATASPLEAALDGPGLRGARVAVLVVRARDGAVLFERQPDALLAPASNQKILTALAALAALGPSHRFTTTVQANRQPDANGSVGTLFVRGGGDPALTSEEWWRLSADLRRQGLRRIEGDIVVDDRFLDAQRSNPAWGAPSARAYYPAVGGLMANYGSFTIEVAPGAEIGAPVRVSTDPALGYFFVENTAKTVARGAPDALAVDRGGGSGGERVLVSGSLAVDAAPQVVYRSVAEPALYAGNVLRMQLVANDIHVGGEVRAGDAGEPRATLLAFQGKTLAEIVRLFMKYSNNAIAETLCKDLATAEGQGSWSGGIAAMRRELSRLGVDLSPFTLLDGSGLSPGNRISPRGLVAALRAARDSFAFGPDFISALPIAGQDGTLQQRGASVRARVRAKTGLLTGAVGLSGFALLADGEQAVFSILINDYDGAEADAMRATDRFVTALVSARSEAERIGQR